MKKYGAILGGAVVLSIVAFCVVSSAIGGNSGDIDRSSLTLTDASCSLEMVATAGAPLAALGDEAVYFVPIDIDGTVTTTVFLVNTNNSSAQIGVAAWYWDGDVHTPPQTVTLAARGMMTLHSNPAYVYNGMVWDLPGAASARLMLPAGVIVDGFIAWNGDDPYHPEVPCLKVPLRFTHISQ